MICKPGDVALVRAHVVAVHESDEVSVEYGDGWRQVIPISALVSVERAIFEPGDAVQWTGKDDVRYRATILALSADPTGVVWAWVTGPTVPNKFASLKTTELERAS